MLNRMTVLRTDNYMQMSRMSGLDMESDVAGFDAEV